MGPEATKLNSAGGNKIVKSYIVYPRLWVVGNFSRFVRPGWFRIEATAKPAEGVLVTAYKDKKTGAFAVVAINKTDADQALSLAIDGAKAAAATPYRTSAKENLQQLDEVKFAGGKLPVTLAPKSVTTFVGKAK